MVLIKKDSEIEFIRETTDHINNVATYMNMMSDEISLRGKLHDASKLEVPEKDTFIKYTPKLKASTYGSDEYKGFLKSMNVALTHHYENNRHHPEHFKNGISDMTIIDLVEMICDWKAATLRHDNGDLFKSIEINQNRFGYDDLVKNILINTAKGLYKYKATYNENGSDRELFFDTCDKIDRDTIPEDIYSNLIGHLIHGDTLDCSIKLVVNKIQLI